MTDKIKGQERNAGSDARDGHDRDATTPEAGALEVQPEQEGAEDVGAEVTELRSELDTLNDRHLRLAAEFDNYRKRSQRDRKDLESRLRAEIISPLLDVLDDLERVSGTEEAAVDSLLEGIRLVEKKFRSSLTAAGLEAVKAEGQPFDPEVMEALMMVPTSEAERDGRVADVFQGGYRVGNALIRPARVRVYEYDGSDTAGPGDADADARDE